ncbi:MAG: dockerin type I repeat-containing protein [Planctomycetota bacterium]
MAGETTQSGELFAVGLFRFVLLLGLVFLFSPLPAQQFEVNLEVSTTSGIGYTLLAGMAQGASDSYVPGEDQYAPPAPPSPSFYSSIIYDSDAWFTCILEPDPQELVFVINLQFNITDPILIAWNPATLAAGGEYVLEDAFGGGILLVDLSQQDSVLIDNLGLTNLILRITPPPGELFRRADINQDGSHNLADAVRLLEHLFLSEPIDCREAGDCNDDSGINVADAVYLLAYLFSGGVLPPAPFTDCGVDPTPDSIGCIIGCP